MKIRIKEDNFLEDSKGLKLCTTDKQADFFTGIKDKRKKELGL